MRPPLSHWIATGLGVGILPWAPGTAGAVLGLATATAFRWAAQLGHISFQTEVLALLGTCVLGIWAAARYGQASGKADASEIVIDEITGQWIMTLPLSLDLAHPTQSLGWWFAAFVLFRLLDILKPWPIGPLDRLSKRIYHPLAQSAAVMADDWLAAGIGVLLLLLGKQLL